MMKLSKALLSTLLVAVIFTAVIESVFAKATPIQVQQENFTIKRHRNHCTKRKLRRNRKRNRIQRRNIRVRNQQTQPAIEKPVSQPVINQ